MTNGVEFGLLGPIDVRVAGRSVPVRSPKCRVLLATLLLEPGRLVSVGRLTEAIWDARQPDNPRRAAQLNVTRLRALLDEAGAPPLIATGSDGYLIEVGTDLVDLGRFRQWLVAADRAARRSDLDGESTALRAALRQWRGDPLSDVPSELLHRESVPGLREERVRTLERRIDVDLRLGRHAELVEELRGLTARDRLRERLWLQLVTALHRAGRRAEALDAYHEGCRHLAEELGLDPGEELQRLHAQVLGGTPTAPAEAVSLPPVPRQLPPEVSGFAGRAAEVERLHSLLGSLLDSRDLRPAGTPGVLVLSGTAGVGKTALALHWSRRVAEHFPDGQLWVNLRGYDGRATVTPEHALTLFLRALGLPATQIPADLDGQTGLYRSLMDGRRMLVVLDNAGDAEQVRPLLPGGTGCFVLVTSRSELSALVVTEGARAVRLDPFTAPQARQMLGSRLGQRRIDAEPEAVGRIVDACGRLPLALAIVAARAAARPAFPLAALDRQLADAGGGLDRFASPDAAVDVRAVFSWSYRTLSAPAARLFRRLGLHPTPELSAPAAATLVRADPPRIRVLLDELAAAHLVSEYTPDRFVVHDLLHAYAAELTAEQDTPRLRSASQRRLVDWLTRSALRARPLLQPSESEVTVPGPPRDVTPLAFSGDRQAREWYETERHNLIAAVELAQSRNFDSLCWRLAYATWVHLHLTRAWGDLIRTHRAGLCAAERTGDRVGQAHMLSGIGTAYRSTRQTALAVQTHQQALEIFREVDDPAGIATVLSNLGAAYRDAGEHYRSLRCSRQAYALERAHGEAGNMSISLYQIALTLTVAGRPAEALPVITESLEILRSLGHRRGEARALQAAATAHGQLGRHGAAIDHYRQAAEIYRDLDDRWYQAGTLHRLGDALRTAGRHQDGQAVWRQALAVYEELGAPDAAALRAKLRE
ncbi:BTAD domain-containing putative transcriptional regulator [Plantactinospora mayteni]|uniref:SARP family transcriptional regulator n=1 Tax=Plantactinospora mayteni TaxID=566021 RepID=A0ABQ4EHN5_9ACTN|nr:AfsR/SARP family transcriptional regulator [Plantactinospora mayteni]GIG94242.1 SARP family transcriptional regulator [Plantactinospora mayteni]